MSATTTPSSRFNLAPRDHSAALAMGTTATRSDRSALSSDDKRKFYNAATAKITPTFTLTEETVDINSGSFLEKNHDVFLQLNRLKQHLASYCMQDVFTLVTDFDPDSGAPDDSNPSSMINFFDNYLDITGEQVERSNTAYRFWGDEIALENLNWTQDLLINSCAPDLQHEVANKVYAAPEECRGGPLVLYHIIQLTVKTTDRTARAIVNKLQQFKLNKIPGENINTAIAIIRSAVVRLRAANRLPSDIHHIVFDIFLSSTVYAFRSHFQTLETMESPKVKDWDSILKEAEKVYQRMEYEGHWLPRNKKGSSFKALGEPVAHIAQVQNGKPTQDKQGRPIDRNPPKEGQPKERKKDNKTEYWCSHEKCGRWGNHLVEKHDEWYAKLKQKRAKHKKQERNSQSTGTNNPPPVPKTEAKPTSTPQTRLRFAGVAAGPVSNF